VLSEEQYALRQEKEKKEDCDSQKKKDASPSSPPEEKSLGVSVLTNKSGHVCERPARR
jgi:hypothetical protein